MFNTYKTDPLLKYSWFPDSESLYLSHLHEIVYSFLFYQVVFFYVAPRINSLLFGSHYTGLKNKKAKIDFDVHTVSMFQCVVSFAVIYPILFLSVNLDVVDYYDHACSLAAAVSAGYFIWDLTVCLKYFSLYGIEFTAHACVSLYVMLVTLLPLCQTWIGKFLLFEASTPFVNINWYIIQLTSEKDRAKKVQVPLILNIINGLCLMTVFFSVRIVWGNIANIFLFKNMWNARDRVPVIRSVIMVTLNFILNTLNLIWFSKMIKIAKKLAAKSKKD